MRRLWGQKNMKNYLKFLEIINYYSYRQNRFNSKDRKSNWLLMNPGLSDEVNDNLAYVIRSGKTSRSNVDGRRNSNR